MASADLSALSIFRYSQRGLVGRGQVGDLVRPSNPSIADFDAPDPLFPTAKSGKNRVASKCGRTVWRPDLDIVSAEIEQLPVRTGGFHLNPSGMNELNLADRVLC